MEVRLKIEGKAEQDAQALARVVGVPVETLIQRLAAGALLYGTPYIGAGPKAVLVCAHTIAFTTIIEDYLAKDTP